MVGDPLLARSTALAMRLDDEIELVAGTFSSNAEQSRLSGEDLFIEAGSCLSRLRNRWRWRSEAFGRGPDRF